MKNTYGTEGSLLGTKENREYIGSRAGLCRAMCEGKILEGTALLCDSRMRLHVALGDMVGIINKDEAVYSCDGKPPKDIAVITRVGKPVCFKVTGFAIEGGVEVATLSRRAAQKECLDTYLDELRHGDIIQAKVTHLDNFGAFVDIGCGIASLLSIDSISVSRISHPSDRLRTGEQIFVVIKSIDRDSGRIFVSMRELLGTWEQNAAQFEVGQTVAGIIRSIESYGVFIELAPNLAGLAEIREGSSDADVAKVGEYAAVYIKSILPDRMKVKLVLIDSYHGAIPSPQIKYFIDGNTTSHIDRWRYSPACSGKLIESVFEE